HGARGLRPPRPAALADEPRVDPGGTRDTSSRCAPRAAPRAPPRRASGRRGGMTAVGEVLERPRARAREGSLARATVVRFATIGLLEVLIAVFPVVGAGSSADERWLALGAIPMLILQLYLKMLVQADYGFAVTNVAWLLGPVLNIVGNGALALVGRLTVDTA